MWTLQTEIQKLHLVSLLTSLGQETSPFLPKDLATLHILVDLQANFI